MRVLLAGATGTIGRPLIRGKLPRGNARYSRLPPATPMHPASLLASAWQKF